LVLVLLAARVGALDDEKAQETWVVAVSTSRYWANYRHEVNALAVYNAARRFGVKDEKTVLMVAEPCACNAKNPFRGELYVSDRVRMPPSAGTYAYAREQATPQNLKNLLTGRSPGLASGPRSNVLLYLTGHGGDGFLKFHDADEINAFELAAAIAEMRRKRRYRRLLFVVDTCQAASLFRELRDPALGVLGLASSLVGENAYATHPHPVVAVALADRFTRALDAYFRQQEDHQWWHRGRPTSKNTLGSFVDHLRRAPTRSTLHVHDASWSGDWRSLPLTDFFGDPASLTQQRLRSTSSSSSGAAAAAAASKGKNATFPLAAAADHDDEEEDLLAVFGGGGWSRRSPEEPSSSSTVSFVI